MDNFDMMFNIFPIMFFLTFALVFGVIIFTLVKSISQWNKNNKSPRLTVEATVVAKRTHITRHRRNGVDHAGYTSSSTTYYATFQFASGDRLELGMNGSEYGMLIEGDFGDLSFQGTRYLGFVRK